MKNMRTTHAAFPENSAQARSKNVIDKHERSVTNARLRRITGILFGRKRVNSTKLKAN